MKYSILSLLLFLFACQKENSKTAIDLHKEICKDLFSANNTLQTIKFKLTSDTLIIGKKGTGVWINKDLFENYSGGIITMHLKEVYTKEDVILNGLSTLTDKDELLETSGMLYINFLENKKNLVIKRNKKINIEPKSNITPNSNIYSIKNDSIFKWTLNKNDTIYTIIPDFVRNFQFGLIPGENLAGAFVKEIPLEKLRQTIIDDSLRLTKLIEDKKVTDSILFNFNDSFRYEFSVSDLGWINIDLLLKKTIETDFYVTSKSENVIFCSVFIIYSDYKSMYNVLLDDFKNNTNFQLKVLGNMKLIFVTKINNEIYYDKSYIIKNSKSNNFNLSFTKITLDNLRQEFVKN